MSPSLSPSPSPRPSPSPSPRPSLGIRAIRLLLVLSVVLLALAPAAVGAEDDVQFHRQYVDLPHGQVHVLSSRPLTRQAQRTPMVCLAPNPASGNYFRLFMGELGRDRVMIAPDYPGLGQSDPVDDVMDIAGYASVMAATLEGLGYGSDGKGAVDVCGYHTGAYVAQELAILRPDLVRRVLLLGIPFYEGQERREMYEKNVVELPVTEDFAQLEGSWSFAVTQRQDGVTLERAYANFLDAAKARPVRHAAYHAAFSYPGEVQAPKVTQPVLILNTHGSLADQTRALAPYFPEAELVEIPELHHGVFDVGASLLADKARPFLDRP